MPERPTRFSSLRVVREVEPTIPVIKFREKVGQIGLQVFGASDLTYVADRGTLEEELRPGYVASQTKLPISAAKVYPANSLRVVLYERRAPSIMKMESNFERAKTWIRRKTTPSVSGRNFGSDHWRAELAEAAAKHGIEDPDRIGVYGSFVVATSNPDFAHLGREYSVMLLESPETEYLYDEKDIVHGILRAMPHSRRSVYPEGPATTIGIAIARVPLEASDELREEFVSRVSREAQTTKFTLRQLETYDK